MKINSQEHENNSKILQTKKGIKWSIGKGRFGLTTETMFQCEYLLTYSMEQSPS
jgi:hypothetical protein